MTVEKLKRANALYAEIGKKEKIVNTLHRMQRETMFKYVDGIAIINEKGLGDKFYQSLRKHEVELAELEAQFKEL